MKSKSVFFVSVLLGVLLVSAFSVGQVYATTGCFTDSVGSWAESAICWMKDNGITTGVTPTTYQPEGLVTRSQMAVFMQRLANIPPSTGSIYINQGLSAIQPGGNFASTAYVRYFSNVTELNSTAAGSNYYMLSATIPTDLYGRATYLNGVLVCYDATHSATLAQVQLEHEDYLGAILGVATDNTSRTDFACRVYYFSSATQLFATDHVVLNLLANYSSSGSSLYIRSVAFILSPSTVAGTFGPIQVQGSVVDPAVLPDPATTNGSGQ